MTRSRSNQRQFFSDPTLSCAGDAINRRGFCVRLAAGGALWVGASALALGCGQYAAEEGVAYAPWDFPNGETAPERIAVAAAILAASPHNTQPWLFAITADVIDVFADMGKSLHAMDPLGRELFIGLGTAVENLVLAAAAHGRASVIHWEPSTSDSNHVARIDLSTAAPTISPLYRAIPHRHTNRGRYLDGAAPKGLETALRGLIDDPAVELDFLSAGRKAAFRKGTIAATRAIVDDDAMWDASHRWWRQTKADIEKFRDGLTLDATGLGSSTRVLAKMAGDPSAETAGEYWIDNTENEHTTGFAFCLLSSRDRASREQQLRTGRIFQRMHLWAAKEGLAIQPLNQMAERQDREQELGLTPDFGPRLAALSQKAESTVQMSFRIGVEWDPALKSPRRPIAWVTK
jgi:hypothetical protein